MPFKQSVLFFAFLNTMLLAQDDPAGKYRAVQTVFDRNCTSCHSGDEPAGNLSLVKGQSYQNLVNASRQDDSQSVLVRPNRPSESYLYRKVLQDRNNFPFTGDPMPLDREPLSASDLKVIADWISSFPVELWGPADQTSPARMQSSKSGLSETFLATQLVNLPTTRTYGNRTAEFRVLHRFAQMNGGGDNTLFSFFGIDNGAITSLNLGISLRNDLDLLVRRSGENKDVEIALKYVPLLQSNGFPVDAGLYASIDWISRSDVNASNRTSPNFQVLIGRSFGRVGLLVVPSFAFRSNHEFQSNDTRSTAAIGFGAQYAFVPATALTLEYVPRIGGYKGTALAPRFNSWSMGVMHKVNLHVFQILLSNTQLLHTSQYIPGSSSLARNRLFDQGPNFHFGFNIIRQFKW